jgi:transposase
MAFHVVILGTVVVPGGIEMPFVSRRAKLSLSATDLAELTRISSSRSEAAVRVLRSKILLHYSRGEGVSSIARELSIDRPRVELTIDKALTFGVMVSLDDLPGRGRPATVTPEARAWVVSLACQKPVDLGYSYELWTTDLLAQHVRAHCVECGHPSLSRLARGTVSKILAGNDVRPHKIQYYLERRDPDFDQIMAQVLYVYKEVQIWRQAGLPEGLSAVLSYDEKPGMQALGNTAPDLPPVPGKHATVSRDHEYVRDGTLSLLAGIDLLTGEVLAIVRDRHRSLEFTEFLNLTDEKYQPDTKIRIILDNHSAHISREVRTYLETKPNRFEFVFTPKHGSWLNIVEAFFAKMAKTMLREIRAASKEELKRRIELYIKEVNQTPVIFRWKYNIDDIQVV